MQALNLHLEQVAPKNNPVKEFSQGPRISSQDESSFEATLKRAMKKEEQPEKIQSDTSKKTEPEKVAQAKDGNNLDKTNSHNKIEETSEKSVDSKDERVDLSAKKDNSVAKQDEKLSIDKISLKDLKGLKNLKDFFDKNSFETLKDGEKISLKDLDLSKDNSLILSLKKEGLLKDDSLIIKNSDLLNQIQSLLKNDKTLSSELTESLEKAVKLALKDKIKASKGDKDEVSDSQLAAISAKNITSEDLMAQSQKLSESMTLSQENKLDISKTKGNKSENQKIITVIDERTVNSEPVQNSNVTITSTGENSAEMSMSFSSTSQSGLKFEGVSANPEVQSQNFSTMLSQEIQNNSYEFVKAGSMVLKDNKKGSINLILHPDELGSVKVQLELTDKLLAGKIVVATKEAFDAFKSSMGSLTQAFNASGLETSGFELSWSGEEAASQQQQEDNRNFQGFNYEKNISEYVEDSYGMDYIRDGMNYSSSLVNVVV